jgi:hypothetical protein
MGRYYSGDIEGKFWFGIQSSQAPSRFGGTAYEPQVIHYEFSKEEHYQEVCQEIENIEKNLGNNFQKIEDFFKDKPSYTTDALHKAEITDDMLKEYADLLLGKKIKECLDQQDYCNFEAEF